MSIKKFNTQTMIWEFITPTKVEFDVHAEKKATTTELGHVMVDGTTITIDENGRITAVNNGSVEGQASNVDATTLIKGIVQLSNEIDTDSEKLAATPKAVKEAIVAAKTFTTDSIAALVGQAPEMLDTLEELATAINTTDTTLEGLLTTLSNKANATDLTAHTNNAEIHVTTEEKALWNAGSGIQVSETAPANTSLLWISPVA